MGGTRRAGEESGETREVGAVRRAGARRSKIRRAPSEEQEAIRSGWCGEKRAWYTHPCAA